MLSPVDGSWVLPHAVPKSELLSGGGARGHLCLAAVSSIIVRLISHNYKLIARNLGDLDGLAMVPAEAERRLDGLMADRSIATVSLRARDVLMAN